MTTTLDGFEQTGTDDALQVEGFLHLIAGSMDAHAHAGDAEATCSHWREAEALARRPGELREGAPITLGWSGQPPTHPPRHRHDLHSAPVTEGPACRTVPW
jgi:hypothetical protein